MDELGTRHWYVFFVNGDHKALYVSKVEAEDEVSAKLRAAKQAVDLVGNPEDYELIPILCPSV